MFHATYISQWGTWYLKVKGLWTISLVWMLCRTLKYNLQYVWVDVKTNEHQETIFCISACSVHTFTLLHYILLNVFKKTKLNHLLSNLLAAHSLYIARKPQTGLLCISTVHTKIWHTLGMMASSLTSMYIKAADVCCWSGFENNNDWQR